jgi:hypothetical protein
MGERAVLEEMGEWVGAGQQVRMVATLETAAMVVLAVWVEQVEQAVWAGAAGTGLRAGRADGAVRV